MEKRQIGRAEMAVNPIGLGCMGLTHAYGQPVDEDEGIRILHEVHDMGYDLFDTAECYRGVCADGTTQYNEELVGKALKNVRHEVVICTKFGVRHKGDHLETYAQPEEIRQAVEGSLRRLRTDYIDLYYQHRIDPNTEPEAVADVMADLIREGKIRAWGISETTDDYLRRAHQVCPVTAIQNRFSMLATWHRPLLSTCEQLGISFVAFSPLANGFLKSDLKKGEQYDNADVRRVLPQFTDAAIDSAAELLQFLDALCDRHHASRSQVSLAWVLAQSTSIITIPGSRRIENIRSNFESQHICMTADEIAAINTLLERMDIPVFGGSKIVNKR